MSEGAGHFDVQSRYSAVLQSCAHALNSCTVVHAAKGGAVVTSEGHRLSLHIVLLLG